MEPEDLNKIVVPVFSRICYSARSYHFQVAEAALRFIRDDQSMSMHSRYHKQVKKLLPFKIPFSSIL